MAANGDAQSRASCDLQKPVVLYHAGCWDGFCAAWLLWRKYPDGTFIPVSYGGAPPADLAGRDVIIADFSYPAGVLLQLYQTCRSLRVYDHHESAELDLRALRGVIQAESVPRAADVPFSEVVFDTARSGCRLVWDAYYGTILDGSAPRIVDYVEDRDLWRYTLPESRAYNAGLRSYPLDFQVWNALHEQNDPERLVIEGRSLLRYQDTVVAQHVSMATFAVIGGRRVPCVNATTLVSEITGRLAAGYDFAASYRDRPDKGLRVFSLRSTPTAENVALVAKLYGGGGHAHAAGFEISMSLPELVPITTDRVPAT